MLSVGCPMCNDNSTSKIDRGSSGPFINSKLIYLVLPSERLHHLRWVYLYSALVTVPLLHIPTDSASVLDILGRQNHTNKNETYRGQEPTPGDNAVCR